MNQNLERISDIEVTITVELGRNKLPIKDLLKLMPGSIAYLDQPVSEHLKFFANGKLIGLCELVVVNQKYGLRVVEIFKNKH